jgi:hypothetical protein
MVLLQPDVPHTLFGLCVMWIATLSGEPQATLSHRYFLDRILARLVDRLVGRNIAQKGFVTTMLLLCWQLDSVKTPIWWIQLKVLHTHLTLLGYIFEISYELSSAL